MALHNGPCGSHLSRIVHTFSGRPSRLLRLVSRYRICDVGYLFISFNRRFGIHPNDGFPVEGFGDNADIVLAVVHLEVLTEEVLAAELHEIDITETSTEMMHLHCDENATGSAAEQSLAHTISRARCS